MVQRRLRRAPRFIAAAAWLLLAGIARAEVAPMTAFEWKGRARQLST